MLKLIISFFLTMVGFTQPVMAAGVLTKITCSLIQGHCPYWVGSWVPWLFIGIGVFLLMGILDKETPAGIRTTTGNRIAIAVLGGGLVMIGVLDIL